MTEEVVMDRGHEEAVVKEGIHEECPTTQLPAAPSSVRESCLTWQTQSSSRHYDKLWVQHGYLTNSGSSTSGPAELRQYPFFEDCLLCRMILSLFYDNFMSFKHNIFKACTISCTPPTPLPPSPSRPSPLKELYLKGSRARLRPSSDHPNYSGENFKVVETLTTTKGEDVKSTRLTRRLTKFLKAKDHHRLVQSANQMRERIVSCRDSLTRWR